MREREGSSKKAVGVAISSVFTPQRGSILGRIRGRSVGVLVLGSKKQQAEGSTVGKSSAQSRKTSNFRFRGGLLCPVFCD